MSTTYMRFTGQQRAAVEHLLDNTPLGSTLERIGAVRRDDGLEIEVDVDPLTTFSSGEWHLWQYLSSLAGYGVVNLWRLLASVDDDCQLACVWSLGMAAGHFAASTPVRFGAL